MLVIKVYLNMTKRLIAGPRNRPISRVHSFTTIDPLFFWLSYISRAALKCSRSANTYHPHKWSALASRAASLAPCCPSCTQMTFSFVQNGIPFMLADAIKLLCSFYPVNLPSSIHRIQRNLNFLGQCCSWATELLTKRRFANQVLFATQHILFRQSHSPHQPLCQRPRTSLLVYVWFQQTDCLPNSWNWANCGPAVLLSPVG